MIKKIYDLFGDIKIIPESLTNVQKTTKYIFLFWVLHPLIDWMCGRINLGIHLNFRFYLIFFPVDISYHLGKIKQIGDNEKNE